MAVKIKPNKSIDSGPAGDSICSEHPAYGVVTVTRSNIGGKGLTLFNSALNHGSVIHVRIHRASVKRSLNEDWINHESFPIVDFDMSEAQWAHFVSSIGNGGGTPITLRSAPVKNAKIEELPRIEKEESMKETFSKEMEDKAKEYTADILATVKRLNMIADAPGSLNKTEIKSLLRDLTLAVQSLPSNVKFTQEQFVRAMEKTVEAGKAEIEGFVRNTLTRAGMAHLASNAPVQLIENSGEKSVD